jgi:hypothetical protein
MRNKRDFGDLEKLYWNFGKLFLGGDKSWAEVIRLYGENK